MKKLTVFLIGFILVLNLTACNNKASNNDKVSSNQKNETENDLKTEKTEDDKNTEKKILVVYYSATNNTAEAADIIAKATNGDTFKIEPANPYTSADLNWTDKDSRVSREHNNENERNVELVSTEVEGWDSYDTIFIGYPIWWGIAAWPVDGFIKANDFTGKTVIPFCTSASSGLGESGELLEELAGTGNWLEGKRFRSGASKEDIEEWIEDLEL